MSSVRIHCLLPCCFLMVYCGYFEDDLNYIAKVFPEPAERWCPNIPYYGGYTALAGERSKACLLFNAVDEVVEMEVTDSVDAAEHKPFFAGIEKGITKPVIILWTHRMKERIGYIKECPNSQCVITENRNWHNHTLTKAILFYGTLMKLTDLPLPRPKGQLWALMHEESPKNNPVFSYNSMMELFNVTSTFRQESNYPLNTQFLRDQAQLETKRYMKTVQQKNRFKKEEGLAPIIYVQSDCDVPSDRDRLVRWMMKYIKIDSYGKCVNNKELPKHLQDPIKGMDHKDFVQLVSKYKFSIAMENGICKDYVTEKFWRPLVVGTIPITFGTPNIKDFAPSDQSVIDVQDFNSINSLVDFIKNVDNDDSEYETYRQFKQTGIQNPKLKAILDSRPWEPDFDVLGMNLDGNKGNFVDHFDCYLCDLIHDELEGKQGTERRREVIDFKVTKSHYGCPLPMEFVSEDNLSVKRHFSEFWYSTWMVSYCDMKAMLELSSGGEKYYTQNAFKAASKRCLQDGHWKRRHLD